MCENDAEIGKIIESLRQPGGSYSVSRAEIFSCAGSFERLVKILWWGYPSGMRARFDSVIAHSRQIAETIAPYCGKTLDEMTFINLYNQLNTFEGMGQSTISKLLYFFEISIGANKTVIIDSRVMGSMSYFDDFEPRIPGPESLRYLGQDRQINQVASAMDVAPEKVEYFLFNCGRN